MGSEMCIRDRKYFCRNFDKEGAFFVLPHVADEYKYPVGHAGVCVLWDFVFSPYNHRCDRGYKMALYEIKNLNFTYPDTERPAIQNLNFSIEPGEFVVICGKSGCGKTTLLRHFKTVLSPYGKREGEILFEGEKLEEVSVRRQSAQIGYVLQSPDNQIVTDKVWHELAFGVENLGYDQQTIRLRVAEMASFFGIQNWFDKNVEELLSLIHISEPTRP